MSSDTLPSILRHGADGDVALAAPALQPMTYADLRRQVFYLRQQLNGWGIGRDDRVAVVLPNGPEMAAVFVAVTATSAVAPLNPAYKLDELVFYLEDLRPRALIVAVERAAAVVDAAERTGVPLIELSVPAGARAGELTLARPSRRIGDPVDSDEAKPDDLALLLHTSGTTARPKLVPLSHRNLCASAGHVCETLRLTRADRCLNVMPLFHIHGLVGALLSSLAAGASVACTPGFNAFRFFEWMHELRPTWYTAVPSMHQAVAQRAGRRAEIAGLGDLRLIRSSSSALPPSVMAELERVFGVPVIESYGMTEAAHQMASNPLPPRKRTPGTVGVPAGVDVAVMRGRGELLEAGEVGEVVIRGPSIMGGYLDNPTANAEAFADGWFRTGDQGVIDSDGYLTITGRLKEIINRGGEKISPREVDEVLLDHPAVSQAMTFALPHELLGETVAAAVVLREGASAQEKELRAFAAERLADFKVPRKLLILDEIPKGPTGKIQRVGMAARLGLADGSLSE
jgi:acyl-CoA synthetase (AMP-forming)/AMP-acid ligase II